jgi:putative membrane protein
MNRRRIQMRLPFAVATAFLAFVASASAQSVGERSGVNSALGVSPSTADFVKEAAIGGLYEVEVAKLAQQKATDDRTKQFAAQMIKDHIKANDELKAKAQALKVDVPAQLDSSHQTKLDKMKDERPADFTKSYRSAMVSDHKTDVSLFERYAKGGENAGLKSWAAQTLPTLQHHLQMAQELDK